MANRISRRRFLRNAAGSLTVASTLTLAACGSSDDDDDRPKVSFDHGVASGDPMADRVILWTRATPERDATLTVQWEVAEDEAFSRIVASGEATTDSMRDYTVKVDAQGLQAATAYWYRFAHGETLSPVGRTRTLPTGAVAQVRLAVFSCSNFPAGYFHVYAEAAKRGDLDAAVHLGDYIYEYGREGYASGQAADMQREVLPDREIITLADYRQRYALYRGDPDLQALHAAMPMIAVWDDHEVTDNTWKDGAANHQPDSEADFELRKAAAIRAYHEWLPTREQQPLNQVFRRFDFGDLLSLHMLDTRVLARDRQLALEAYLPELLGNPDPQAGLEQFIARFGADVSAADRQLLGAPQVEWLRAGLAESRATWQVLGQQVLMTPVQLPLPVLLGMLSAAGRLGDVKVPAHLLASPAQYVNLLQRQAAGDPTLTESEQALLALPCLPYNLDSWDGYWAARESVLAAARDLDRNLVVLAGDTHNAWAGELRDMAGTPVGVEFATSSVSSPGFEEYLAGAGTPAELAALVTGLTNLNNLPPIGRNWAGSLKYAETSLRGYMVLTATHEAVRADWHYVDTVKQPQYTATLGHGLRCLPGQGNRKLLPA